MDTDEKFLKLKEIDEEIEKLRSLEKRENISLDDAIRALDEKKNSFLSNLETADIVYISRHPDRPHTKDYIENIFEDFCEFSGDRLFSDDKAIIAGFASLSGKSVCVVGLEKGKGLDDKVERNFGMAHPEGYRKAARIFKLADKFDVPIITFIDTPGAYPGIDAEKRGQSVAIAENLKLLFQINVPVLAVIIGEGGSGGALAIGVADTIIMLENSIYSVISPEGCASILWRDAKYAGEAAENLKLTSGYLKKLGVIDHIIREPLGGAHKDPEQVFKKLKKVLYKKILELKQVKGLKYKRIEKFSKMGIFNE